jgi:DNA transposition AAA+ family ATPase
MNAATRDGGQPAETRGAWPAEPAAPAQLGAAARAAWAEAAAGLRALAAAQGWSQGETAKRAGVPIGTLSPWYHGKYTGDYASVTERVNRFLASHAEAAALVPDLPEAPGFVQTPTARRLVSALVYAQTLPEIAVVTLAAGCGKTTVARHYAATRPHVWLVTMRPSTASRGAMLAEIAAVLDVAERNQVRLDRAIGAKLSRGRALLIIDEAQCLTDEALHQLRYFADECGCGIALFGNAAVWRRWAARSERERDGLAQIQSRIGYRILQPAPLPGDAEAILDAWGIAGCAETRRLALALARMPGALRTLDKTLRLAALDARGRGQALGPAHLRAAWALRATEDLVA